MTRFPTLLLAGVSLLPIAAHAQSLPPVDVYADSAAAPVATPNATRVTPHDIANFTPRSRDAAQALGDTPGLNFFGAGGVSSLPVIHGFNDDRNAVVLGGVPITAACANHMNPPLSYVDPAAIGGVEVLTVNVPVSKGGDSIGGAIIVTPRPPVFATPAASSAKAPAVPTPAATPFGPGVVASGSISGSFNTNGGGFSLSGHGSVATRQFSLDYDGAWTKSGDYHAGGGALVRSSEYQATNHAARLAYQNDGQTIAFRYAYQYIPYQGFPNQYMDMLGNNANSYDLSYKGAFAWGRAEANAYYHITQHYMNFLPDRVGYATSPQNGMPMYVNGQDFGYRIKAEIDATPQDLVRVGNELHMQRLNDWWPSPQTMVMGGMPMANMTPGAMCCATFVNINNGQRDVLGTYVEWEHRWSKQWSTLFGLRNDTVWMNTGDVQGYSALDSTMSMMGGMSSFYYLRDSTAFNAQNHARTDVNFDVAALARYTPDDASQYELGYTRKTRSPSIYERYTWSTGAMASSMIGWFGDGNGYVGNIDLKPEVANTIAASAQWSDPAHKAWNVKLTPYYSYVQDYIDVDKIGVFGSGANASNLLQFANHDAQLAGVDLSGRALILQSPDIGDVSLAGIAGYTYGRRIDGQRLYHMMPLNGKVALEDAIAVAGGRLAAAFEVKAAAAKTDVETLRLEPTTPAYAVLNLRTSFEYQNLRFDLGVENLADKLYYEPLGGIDIADYTAGANGLIHTPVAAIGRTLYGGATVKF
jgi:iron complex outermembrane receptor protein